MDQKQISIGIAGLVVGLLLGPAVLPSWGTMRGSPMQDGTMRRGGVMQGSMMEGGMMGGARDMDRHFIERMIPHHEDAIEMAEEALAKAEHTELKQLAGEIQAAQQSEIDTMRQWYADWYGEDPVSFGTAMETMMHMGMQGPRMERSGAGSYSFDIDFIDAMIPHHQMAVMMAQMLLVSSERAEMRDLAESIIEAQSKEIETMRAWRSAWAK